jgi:hypothetical protein
MTVILSERSESKNLLLFFSLRVIQRWPTKE